jgi:hypothetical protein
MVSLLAPYTYSAVKLGRVTKIGGMTGGIMVSLSGETTKDTVSQHGKVQAGSG